MSKYSSELLRQWDYFPHAVDYELTLSSPQIFLILVESASGRRALASVELRTAPDKNLAAKIVETINGVYLTRAAKEQVCMRFRARQGFAIKFYDVSPVPTDALELTDALPRTISSVVKNIGLDNPSLQLITDLRASLKKRLEDEWKSTYFKFANDGRNQIEAYESAIISPKPPHCRQETQALRDRNRLQAVQVFPLLQPVLMTNPFTPILAAIDNGLPLIDALSTTFHATKAAIRALHGVTVEEVGLSLPPKNVSLAEGLKFSQGEQHVTE